MNSKIIKTILFVIMMLITISSALALSLDASFENGYTTKTINPGQSAGYDYALANDPSAEFTHVTMTLYDKTEGTVNLGVIEEDYVYDNSFYSPVYFITSEDYNNLPGSYMLDIRATEKISGNPDIIRSEQLYLEVTGERYPNKAPTVDFTYTPSSPTTDDTVTFTATASDEDGTIVMYVWYANGDKIGEGRVITHKFDTVDTHLVKVVVTDDDGATASKSRNVVVRNGQPANVAPVADFSFSPANPQEGQQVEFTSTAYDSDGNIVEMYWNSAGEFNYDMSTGIMIVQFPHTFDSPGTYQVTQRVVDNDGAQHSVTKSITVSAKPVENVKPRADFTFSPTKPLTGESVSFRDNSYDSDGTVVAWKWDFENDGTIDSTSKNPTHTFTSKGAKIVKLIVTDNDGATDDITKKVSVSEPVLIIDELGCNDNVVKGHEQHCSVHVTTDQNSDLGIDVENSKITFKYSNNDEVLGTCYTTNKGYCHINPIINKNPGYYEVYAIAEKTGYESDDSKLMRDTFRVWEKQYEIRNLRTYEDLFVTEQYEFYRANPVYAAFDVYDLWNNQYVSQNSDLIEDVFLRVNNADPLDFNPIGTFNMKPVAPSTLNKGGNSIASEAGSWKYKLDSIPITDDYLGNGKVFAFVFNFKDDTAGQDSVDVNILNNKPEFNPPTRIKVTPGQTIQLDFKNYLSDVETPNDEFVITYGNTGRLTLQHVYRNVFEVFAPTNFVGEEPVDFHADDTDGDGVSRTIIFYTDAVANNPPNAHFTYSPSSPLVNEEVTFTSDSTDSDGSIVSHRWYVDGSSKGTNSVLKFSFNQAKTYTVKLVVYDDDGATDYYEKQVTVREPANIGPNAHFTWTPTTPVEGQSARFTSDSTDSDGSIVSQVWLVDNTDTYYGNEISIIFNTQGTHKVKLTVTDDDGAKDSYERNIEVRAEANNGPHADFTFSPSNPTTDDTVRFTSTSTDSDGYIVSHVWKIEGVIVGEDSSVLNHKFNAAGTYSVSLTVTDDDGATDSETKNIVIGEGTPDNVAPVANFVYNPSNPLDDQIVTFTSTSTDSDGTIVSYKWKIEGIVKGTSSTLLHTFTEPGTYEVKLTVTDDDGASSTHTKWVVVQQVQPDNEQPVADFEWQPVNPIEDEIVTFTSTSYDADGTIVSYQWKVNGQVKGGNSDVLSHTFTSPGTYNVHLIVTDDDGATGAIIKWITISEKEPENFPPNAHFTWSPRNPIEGQTVTLTSDSTDRDGYIVSYQWTVDGTRTYTGEIINVVFDAGTHHVKLKVTDDDGAWHIYESEIFVSEIANEAPVAQFRYSPSSPIEGDTVDFVSESFDSDGTIVRYEWKVDGALVSTSENFNHIFANPGSYSVSLKVIDDDGAYDIATQTILVFAIDNIAPVAQFIYSPSNPFVGDVVHFTSESYDSDGQIVSYKWMVEGVIVGRDATMNHVFDSSGTYRVKLGVTDDDGATSYSYQNVIVREPANVGPDADFIYSPTSPKVNDDVAFISTSTDSDGTIVHYVWSINGVPITEQRSFVHVFSSPGTYTVSLTVTDDDGATDSTSKNIVVGEADNVAPVANFNWNPSNPKAEETVTFDSTSTDSDGTIVSYAWKINGAPVSNTVSFNHIFATSGTYTVSLTVTDDDGATDSTSKNIVVGEADNVAPVANFDWTPLNPKVGQTVLFNSLSTDSDGTIVSYTWRVDGGAIKSGNPINVVFTTVGTHTVSLTVTDDDGATDSITKTITIREADNVPPVADFEYSPTSPIEGDTVTFTSTAYDSDGYIVSYEWTINGVFVSDQESFDYLFTAPGTYTVVLTVTDNRGASVSITKVIVIGEDVNKHAPVAILKAPPSTLIGKEIILDGSDSYDRDGRPLVAYVWIIKKGTAVIDSFTTTVPTLRYTFTTRNTHTIELTVIDDEGLTDTDSKSIAVGKSNNGEGDDRDDGLWVDYFEVYGTDRGVIHVDEAYTVTATVTNDRNERLDDVVITFQIPEIGYKISSQKFDLKPGETKNMEIQDYMPFLPGDIEPGEYYALIGAKADNIIRTKYYPLIIE